MSIRNRFRQLIIHTASISRIDELALRIQNRKDGLGLVVAMHETPQLMRQQLKEQLDWVSQHFSIVSLQHFAELWLNPRRRHQKPPILFTFDDGRASNYEVAAPLLESYGARGVFFIVPAFAKCPPEDALAFYRSRINPNARSDDEEWKDWKPMNSSQIAELAARGHAIGSHTLTHRDLRGLSSEELESEIGGSARKLEQWIGKPIDAFAWAYGSNAFDARASQIVRRYHRFCFAPCAGAIDFCRDSAMLIWRREIEVKYPPAEYRFQYSGLADLWWRNRRQQLNIMLKLPLDAPERP